MKKILLALFFVVNANAVSANQIGILGTELYEENTLWSTNVLTEIVFEWITGTPLSDGTLEVEIFGDFNADHEYVSVYGENNTLLSILDGGTDLVTPHSYSIDISQNLLTSWAADNLLSITFIPSESVAPGLSFNTPQADYVKATLNYEATPAPVPEPATILLLGTGLVGLAGTGFRRKKQ